MRALQVLLTTVGAASGSGGMLRILDYETQAWLRHKVIEKRRPTCMAINPNGYGDSWPIFKPDISPSSPITLTRAGCLRLARL